MIEFTIISFTAQNYKHLMQYFINELSIDEMNKKTLNLCEKKPLENRVLIKITLTMTIFSNFTALKKYFSNTVISWLKFQANLWSKGDESNLLDKTSACVENSNHETLHI